MERVEVRKSKRKFPFKAARPRDVTVEISEATSQITKALRRIADEYEFIFDLEVPYFLELGTHLVRVDVVFRIPGHNGRRSRPVLCLEIDNDPARVAHNQLKIWGDVYSLSSLPFAAVAVLHGRAEQSPLVYAGELLAQGFELPPRFLGTVNLDNSSPKTIESGLRKWLQNLIKELKTAPEWGSVFKIANQYQSLIGNLSLDVAAAHLEVHSELAWFLVGTRQLESERAACLSITLARMLQRAGRHPRARQIMRTLRQRTASRSLGTDTEDDALAVEFLLDAPAFDDNRALTYLSTASENLHTPYHKSQFHWRKAIVHILEGHADRVHGIIESYRSMMPGSTIAESNAALLDTIASLRSSGHGDPREHAKTYAGLQQSLLFPIEEAHAPDGTVHGVATSL